MKTKTNRRKRMNALRNRQLALCGIASLLIAGLLAGGGVYAQGATFSQRARIELAMDNAPSRVADALEAILTADQVRALEAALLPQPTDDTMRAALEAAKTRLLQAGFAKNDPLVVAVETRENELKPVNPVE